MVEILTEPDNRLSRLAKIAGADPKSFYTGANFRHSDLSDEDLTQFNLEVASKQSAIGKTLFFSKERWEFEYFTIPDFDEPRVRMSALLLEPLHELLAIANPRRLSFNLEHSILTVLQSLDYDDFSVLRSRPLEQDAALKLDELGVEYPKLRQRFAYVFSEDTRELIYHLAARLSVTSGVAFSRLIYWIFCNDLFVSDSEIKQQHIALLNEKGEALRSLLDVLSTIDTQPTHFSKNKSG